MSPCEYRAALLAPGGHVYKPGFKTIRRNLMNILLASDDRYTLGYFPLIHILVTFELLQETVIWLYNQCLILVNAICPREKSKYCEHSIYITHLHWINNFIIVKIII